MTKLRLRVIKCLSSTQPTSFYALCNLLHIEMASKTVADLRMQLEKLEKQKKIYLTGNGYYLGARNANTRNKS